VDSGSIIAIVAAVLIAYAVILWLGTILWAYRDIRERTRDGMTQTIALLLVVIFNIPGLILYMILRPRETLSEAYERRLEAELLMREAPETVSCPGCLRHAREDFVICPYCRTKLRERCTSCGKHLDLQWSACPYCGAPGPQPASRASGTNAEASPRWTPAAGDRPAETAASPPSPQ
jgi:hypothetical protein